MIFLARSVKLQSELKLVPLIYGDYMISNICVCLKEEKNHQNSYLKS